VDTNASFFIGMGLLVLDKTREADLDKESRQRLQRMFPPLERWFEREVRSRTFYYPNKYLGDLVCAWLLHDYSRRSVEELRTATLDATAYWQEQSWGWGEHMSDVYANVMLNQLSVVLLFAEHLPPEMRAAFQDLAQRLLVINDAFAGGPRVPLIRSYAFQKSPHPTSFRESIYDWKGQGMVPPTSYPADDLGHFFWERGWHDVFGAKAVHARDHAFSCFGGNTAVARVEADIRFGSVSTFPLMPSAEYKTWGLSWQSFPVAFWRQQGDWGFLRGRTVEQGQERCHPAIDKARAYLDNALNQSSSPPITGQTVALQQGDSILVMRRMPVIVDSWDSVGDGLTLIEPHFTAQSVEETESGWRLRLQYPERAVTVDCLRLPGTASPLWTSGEDGVASWRTELAGDSLRGARGFVALWLFHFGAKAGVEKVQLLPYSGARVPVPRSGSEQGGIVQWRDADGEQRAAFDPLSAKPLQWVR